MQKIKRSPKKKQKDEQAFIELKDVKDPYEKELAEGKKQSKLGSFF